MLFLDLVNPYIKPIWYDVFQYVLLKCFTLTLWEVYNDINNAKCRQENISLVLLIPGPRPRVRIVYCCLDCISCRHCTLF